MSYGKFLFLKTRKLSTEIRIVFLFLIAASSAIIISFTYYKNNKLIGKLAEGTISRVSSLIVDKIECMLNALAVLPKEGAGYYRRHPTDAVPSDALLFFLLDTLASSPHLYAYYVGAPNGSAMITFNLNLTDKPNELLTSPRPTPPNTTYLAIIIDRSTATTVETWKYFDQKMGLISQETIPSRNYDPRIRPWYMGAKESGKLFWTDVFAFDPTGDPGIAVAIPVYDKAGTLQCIYGADLSLHLFDQFLTEQKVGKKGTAFILDPAGNIIIPKGDQSEAAKEAFAQYQVEKKKAFSFEYENVKYLATLYAFPINFDKNWLVLVIDPITDYFSEAIQTEHEVVLISVAVLLIAAFLVGYLAKHISAPIVVLSHEIDKITRLELDSDERVASDIEEINLMDYSIADLRNAIRSFSRYAPKEVVKRLMAHGKNIVLGGEKKEITILFTDINNFTPMVETLSIEEVTSLLAEYFDLLSKIILENNGTIDKYIGDSIMAFWGAPQEMNDHAARACRTALLCQEALSKMNQKREKEGRPPFYTRFGINTGNVIVGNIGTSERMNYTVIGDAVNATARIQGLNRDFHTQILISGETARRLGNEFAIKPLGTVEVKGKKEKIEIFELLTSPTKSDSPPK